MEVIKCRLIMITKPTKKHWYFFLFILGSFFRVFVPDILFSRNDQNYEQHKEKDYYKNILLTQKYFEMIRTISSDLLIGIFHCIHKIRNKDDFSRSPQQTYNRNSQKIYFIFNDETSRVPTMYKIIFIISIIDIVCQLLMPIKYIIEGFLLNNKYGIINYDTYYLFILLWFDIFARYLFSRWILKTYFYLHHYFSFFLNFIGLTLITIVDTLTKIDSKKYNLLYISFASLQVILYSFEDIMNKVAFRTLYILPNTLIFYKGLVQLFYFLIISGLFFKGELYEFKHCFNYFFEIKHFLCFVPFNIMRTVFLVKVIDTFSAQHMALLKISETAVLFIYTSLAEYFDLKKSAFSLEPWHYIIQFIGFTFLIISSLIHNELIIINQTKLKAKTEYYLDKDADKEQNSSFYSDTLFTDSKDSSNSVTNLYSDLTGSDIS